MMLTTVRLEVYAAHPFIDACKQRTPSLLWLTGKLLSLFIEPCHKDVDIRYHIPSGAEPLIAAADSTLINGLGRYPGGPSSPLAVINVHRNRRYRMRLFSISCDPNFIFTIDNHDMVRIKHGERISYLIIMPLL